MSLWIQPYDLNLTDVKRNEVGAIVSGFVVNGAWWFERKDGEILCKDEWGYIKNRFPDDKPIVEVEAPSYQFGGM